MVPDETHQEPCSDVPAGPSVLAERQKTHEQVLRGDTGFENVVLKLDQVRRAVKKGYTASEYLGGDYTFISTSTMADRKTDDLGWDEEADWVRRFGPQFHIPTDYPVYSSDPVAVREGNISNITDGMRWMISELAATKTRVLPLLKGITPGEREVFYNLFREFGLDGCAFYGTQYFTQGPGFPHLNRDLHRVQSEFSNLDVFLIGLLSPRCLSKAPSNVVGAAGQAQWRERIGLRETGVGIKEMRQRSRHLSGEVAEVLGQGQVPLNIWADQVQTEVVN